MEDRFLHRADARDSPNIEDPISHSTNEDAGVEEANSGTGGPWILQAQHITVGTSGAVHEEEGWINATLHRLQTVEQGHNQEQVPSIPNRQSV